MKHPGNTLIFGARGDLGTKRPKWGFAKQEFALNSDTDYETGKLGL